MSGNGRVNMKQGEVKFTYSGILIKNQKKIIRVRFEREKKLGIDYAEGTIPDCKIEKQQGFTPNEIEQMEAYLVQEKENIIQDARKLNNIINWF